MNDLEKKSFLVTTYDTRGSVPVSRSGVNKYGGNTTCLRIESECIPKGTALVIDAGTGFLPLAYDLLKEDVKPVIVLQTHYHHDHTQGFLLAPLTFIKVIPMHLYGPVQNGIGPKEAMETIMRKPFFPIDFKLVSSHFHCHKFEYPQQKVILLHPQGGVKMLNVDDYERALLKDGLMTFASKQRFNVEECLVVRMHPSEHPEQTVSFRFEERPSNKVFCLLTDHESQDGIPMSLKNHLKDVDLLIQDVQYDEVTYQTRTAGYGHGTPKYAVRLAIAVGAKKLGLTHHDLMANDEKIDAILEEAVGCLKSDSSLTADDLFACQDYGKYLV
ncbi:MAG: hypothetical protein GQ527_03640 [Bacteroidales bacterium]|nr:hypothetical protein [Bacteroidales bacterium]